MARTPDQIRKSQTAAVEALRAQRDLSPEGLKRRIARVHQEHDTEMRQAKREIAEAREVRYDELRRKMFGNPTAGDPSSAISFRDALDRASQVKTAREAQRLMQLAHHSGDTALGKAVAMRALEEAQGVSGRSWTPLINEWAQVNGVDAELTEIGQLTQSGFATGLQRHWATSLTTPGEVKVGHVRDLASQADPAGRDGGAQPVERPRFDVMGTGAQASAGVTDEAKGRVRGELAALGFLRSDVDGYTESA